LNEAGTEFGIPLENMLTNYAPRIKKSGMTVGEAVKTWKMSDEYKWWAEEERTGHLLAHEEDIRKVVHSYINRGARKKYLGAEIELATKTIKDANQSGQFTAAENMLLEKYIADVKGTPAGMDAAFQEVGLKMGRSLNKIIDKATFGKAEKRFTNPQYKKLRDEKGKLIKGKSGEDIVEMIGEEPGFFNTQSLMDDMISFHLRMSYAGALGFKPMAAMRNLLQPWITVLPVVGGIDFAIGMRRAMTKEGWNEAKAAGIMMDDYLPVAGEQTMVATGVLANIAYTSLKPYKLADSFNRAVAYHAMKSKVLRNGKTYTEGMRSLAKPEDAVRLRNDFIENTDLEFFHPVIMKNEILPLLKAGDMKALGERMGFQMAEQTQWVYRRANSPYFCRGKAGKLFGQFGTWPAWYADYMRTISTRGSKTNRAKRVATWATVNAGISEVGAELFGVDLGRYLWDGPFSWFGGISVSAITGFHKVIFGNEQEQAQGAQQ